MDVRKIVLLVGVLLVAAVTAVMAKNRFSGAGAPTASATPGVPVGPEILVATRALPVGTIIDAEALRYQPWPEGLVQNAYYAKGQEGSVNPADLLGTVVRNEITAGQPVTQGSLIKPGERGFLAAALGPGMRAVTVSVSTTSGVAGFVFPGDRVDLVLTQEVTGDGDRSEEHTSELQSLMRISYAVFCLKKKKKLKKNKNTVNIKYNKNTYSQQRKHLPSNKHTLCDILKQNDT